jgi:hypothetical protein
MFVTAQPNAHVRFRRAIERRALWLAEDAARELPNLPLEDERRARPRLKDFAEVTQDLAKRRHDT